jgi:uncharacterized protein (DUF1778 family)
MSCVSPFEAATDGPQSGGVHVQKTQWNFAMTEAAEDDDGRMNLRARPEQRALLMRAAALKGTYLMDFVLQSAFRAAEAVVGRTDHFGLSARDGALVLDLLESPPAPDARLSAAAKALPASE